MRKALLGIVFGGLVIFSFSCKSESEQKQNTTKTVGFTKHGELSMFNINDSLYSSFDIEIANDEYERQIGLMGRTSLGDDQGMLFIFTDEEYRSFYMKNTYLPLDIIFINSAQKVINIQKNAKPRNEASLPSSAPAQYVFEINAGLSDKIGIKPGDSISFRKIEK